MFYIETSVGESKDMFNYKETVVMLVCRSMFLVSHCSVNLCSQALDSSHPKQMCPKYPVTQ